jgi:hypothetical protein
MKYIIGYTDKHDSFNVISPIGPRAETDLNEACKIADTLNQHSKGEIYKVYQIQEVDHDLIDHRDPDYPFELDIGGESE